jgi:putative transposase
MDRFAHGCAGGPLGLYRSLVDPSYLEEVRRGVGRPGGWGLFSPALTVWLMVRCRLLGGCSLERAWQECTAEEALLLSPESARAQRGSLSSHPTGFAYARKALPLDVVRAASDRLYEEAYSALGPVSLPTFLIDGSSLRTEYSAALAQAYPPASNQHGDSHWPMIRIVVAHDLRTGLAVRPEWGPMFGEHAVGEQELTVRLRSRLPKECLIVADRNFGVFQIAWLLQRNMLLRLTALRAGALLGKGKSLDRDWDERVTWRPSAIERRNRPELPEDAAVEGRLIVRHVLVPGKGRVQMCLFTDDLASSAESIVDRYPLRWNIETDLRSLKRVVGLEVLRAKTPDVLAKEILLAVAAFNIVRTLMALAADGAGIEPRRIGFTRACNSVEIYARRGVKDEASFQRMLADIAARPLPIRTGRRAPPRKVWTKTNPYPNKAVEVKS